MRGTCATGYTLPQGPGRPGPAPGRGPASGPLPGRSIVCGQGVTRGMVRTVFPWPLGSGKARGRPGRRQTRAPPAGRKSASPFKENSRLARHRRAERPGSAVRRTCFSACWWTTGYKDWTCPAPGAGTGAKTFPAQGRVPNPNGRASRSQNICGHGGPL